MATTAYSPKFVKASQTKKLALICTTHIEGRMEVLFKQAGLGKTT